MSPLHYLFLASAALLALAALWRVLRKAPPEPRLPYAKRPSLLTPAEVRFYRELLQAVPRGVAVFVKVRLMDVVTVPDGLWQQFGAKGSGMHCDFVLADACTLEPRLVIELDDRSHALPEARDRDAFKDAALQSAGVPLLRIRAAVGYRALGLRAMIEPALCRPAR